MDVRSDDFHDGGWIPAACAFGVPDPTTHIAFGDNRNPHLEWSDVPVGTESIAVTCHDPDVPSKPDDVNQEGREVPADLPRVDFYHWVVVDLPSDLRRIEHGAYSEGVTAHGKDDTRGPHGGRQGRNDYTGWFSGDPDMEGVYLGYDGPCPPWNDSIVHRYVFTVVALDVPFLEVGESFGGDDVRAAVRGHVLAEAALTGRYALNPRIRES